MRAKIRQYDESVDASNFLLFCLTLFQTQKNPDTVSCIIKDLDQNKDDELDFEEFVPFVAGLTIACEKHFALHHEKKGKK